MQEKIRLLTLQTWGYLVLVALVALQLLDLHSTHAVITHFSFPVIHTVDSRVIEAGVTSAQELNPLMGSADSPSFNSRLLIQKAFVIGVGIYFISQIKKHRYQGQHLKTLITVFTCTDLLYVLVVAHNYSLMFSGVIR